MPRDGTYCWSTRPNNTGDKVANIINAAEVQEGDKIAVVVPGRYTDREHVTTYTGVAHHTESREGKVKWYTKADWSLFTNDDNAVIELLDRPKPKIELPTGEYAVVSYQREDDWDSERIAVRAPGGFWSTYDSSGNNKDAARITSNLERIINEHGTDFKVLFEGVAK